MTTAADPHGSQGSSEPAGGTVVKHSALLFSDDEDFLAGVMPILRRGIEAGDATFAITAKKETDILRQALGEDSSAVHFMKPKDVYINPVRAMAAFAAMARTLGPRRAWVVAADDWIKHPDALEWARYDSLLNTTFPDVDFHGFCCYNVTTLPTGFIKVMRQTHPEILLGAEAEPSAHYLPPEEFVARLDRRPLPPCPESAASMRVVPGELHAVRAFVAEQAKRCGITGDALRCLLIAVTEAATNAIRHGAAPVIVKAWPDDGLVCEVTDSGNWQPEKMITWEPPESALERGFGLWGIGMLCDTVQLRTGPDGTTVRLRVRPEKP